MISRGEIGFLIASTAESRGVFSSSTPSMKRAEGEESSEVYLIVVWAVVLCTILGPVLTGLLVKRVKRLQGIERRRGGGEKEDPLGVWGVNQTGSH